MSEKPTWTLLLIDPSAMSRATLKRQLEYYGYAVCDADSGRDGVGLFQQRHREIDLVILDMGINDVPGANALQVLQKIRPDTKVVLITDQTLADGRSLPQGVAGEIGRAHV